MAECLFDWVYKFLKFFVICDVCLCANLRSDLVPQMDESDRTLLVQTIVNSISSEKIGDAVLNDFVFDHDCVVFQRTNVLFFEDCHLPAKCGNEMKKEIDSTFFGNRLNMCYSFHPSNGERNTIPLYNIKFSKTSMPLKKPFVSSYAHTLMSLEEMIPVSFFEHFVYGRQNGLIKMFPKFCLDRYTRVGDDLPLSVRVEAERSNYCVHHLSADIDCAPLAFRNLFDLIDYFDFPIAFKGNCYVALSHSSTLNEACGADEPMVIDGSITRRVILDRAGDVELVNRMSGNSFVLTRNHFNQIRAYTESDDPADPDDYEPYFIVYVPDSDAIISDISYCFAVVSKFHSPLDSISTVVINVFESLFRKLFELLRELAEEIADLLITISIAIINSLKKIINERLSTEFVSFVLIYLSVYLFYPNYILSFVVSLFFYFLSVVVRGP